MEGFAARVMGAVMPYITSDPRNNIQFKSKAPKVHSNKCKGEKGKRQSGKGRGASTSELPPSPTRGSRRPDDATAPPLRTQATLPVTLCFDAPAEGGDNVAGHSVCVSGPHGPLEITIPEGTKPGERVTYLLGPKCAYRATVPEGASEGQNMSLQLPTGESIQVLIPPGKQPGDEFNFSPPILMVQVPVGALPGNRVAFAAPDGRELTAVVPEGMAPGRYFEVADAPLAGAHVAREEDAAASIPDDAPAAVADEAATAQDAPAAATDEVQTTSDKVQEAEVEGTVMAQSVNLLDLL